MNNGVVICPLHIAHCPEVSRLTTLQHDEKNLNRWITAPISVNSSSSGGSSSSSSSSSIVVAVVVVAAAAAVTVVLVVELVHILVAVAAPLR